jgi:DNA invertase Pin-like site-specific DNA recombinase
MKTERRVAIYGRVSTNSGQNPEMQIRELRAYCKNRSWKIVGEFVDSGVSGGTDSRPQLNTMMADAHLRRFDVVAVWDFSRFARSTSHLLRALETFSSLGIEFVSLREQIDTGAPTGKMVFTILGSVAELERSLIGERVRAGLRNAKAKGTRLGRPPLRDFSPADIRQLRRERRGGMSFKRLARKFNTSVWTAFALCKHKDSKSEDS